MPETTIPMASLTLDGPGPTPFFLELRADWR